MAILFVDNLSHNKSKVVQIVVKAIELMLLSAGLFFIFLMVKGAVMPYSCELVFSSLMGFWKSIRCFLSSPLYICIIINFMVLLIKLSSTFHRHETTGQDHDDIPVDTDDDDLQIIPPLPPPETPICTNVPPSTRKSGTKITNTKPLYKGSQQSFAELSNQSSPEALSSKEVFMPETHKIKKKTNLVLNSSNSSNSVKEKVGIKKSPPISIGKGKEKENEEEDTMEATWKAIMGGGKKTPKKKQLKKSETWDAPPRTSNTSMQRLDPEVLFPSSPTWKEMRKLETFNDAVSVTRRGGLRRDFSTSLDDFNKQVEDFIKKINRNIRLQRQESSQRFFEMINDDESN